MSDLGWVEHLHHSLYWVICSTPTVNRVHEAKAYKEPSSSSLVSWRQPQGLESPSFMGVSKWIQLFVMVFRCSSANSVDKLATVHWYSLMSLDKEEAGLLDQTLVWRTVRVLPFSASLSPKSLSIARTSKDSTLDAYPFSACLKPQASGFL